MEDCALYFKNNHENLDFGRFHTITLFFFDLKGNHELKKKWVVFLNQHKDESLSCLFELGCILYGSKSKNYKLGDLGMKYIEVAAAKQHLPALECLARFYTDNDSDRAFFYLNELAKHNYITMELIYCHIYGQGTKVNLHKAESYLKQFECGTYTFNNDGKAFRIEVNHDLTNRERKKISDCINEARSTKTKSTPLF